MNANTLTALLLCTVFLAGCARREDDADASVASESNSDMTATAPEAPPPPKVVAAVRVEVTLSPAAEQTLKTSGEGVQVEVVYGGDPAPGSSLEPNQFGMIELGKKVLELDGAGVVELAESEVDRSRLSEITGQPQIMVNTTSTRKRGPENLLACAFYWDTLSKAGDEGVKIPCTLLSEANSN